VLRVLVQVVQVHLVHRVRHRLQVVRPRLHRQTLLRQAVVRHRLLLRPIRRPVMVQQKPLTINLHRAKKPEEKQNAGPVPDVSIDVRRSSPVESRRPEKEKEATKIYVGKLSLNVNKDHLTEIFGTFGEIKDIDLPLQRVHQHLHRGYAHIEYVQSSGAEQACKFMEGGQIDGREIVCALVHGQAPHLAEGRGRRDPSPYHHRRRRSPIPSRRYPPPPPPRRDRDRDRPRYNDRRGYSPPSRGNRRGQSPPPSSRRPGTGGGNAAESPKKKERRYSRSSSSESK